MPDDVDVAVVGAELEEDLSWTVPLIDDFLDEIFAIAQLKAHWPFVALPACVAVYAQLHLMIVAQNRFECRVPQASSHFRAGQESSKGRPRTRAARINCAGSSWKCPDFVAI